MLVDDGSFLVMLYVGATGTREPIFADKSSINKDMY